MFPATWNEKERFFIEKDSRPRISAALRCREINEAGKPDFHMTVNLSARQFAQEDVIPRIESLLRYTDVSFKNIIISINEGVALGELEKMLQLCSELRKQGIRVARVILVPAAFLSLICAICRWILSRYHLFMLM